MGQEFSNMVYQSECSSPERQILEVSDNEVEVDTLTTPSGVSEETQLTQDDFYSPLSSPIRRGPRNSTVIIFDWDDTLLCSTAINAQQWDLEQLRDLEVAVESVLRTAMSLGETLIVTNGNGTWVQDSSRRFLPALLPTLAQLTVVSARALYESLYPGDPFAWKKAAFKHLLTQERSVSTGKGLNLIALGDQSPEIEAAHTVVKIVGGPSLVKTVKFKEGPSVAELLGQLERAEQELAKIVQEEQSASRSLVRRPLPPHMHHLVSQAPGWRLSTKEESAWSFPRSLAFKDLWPLFS